MNIPSQDCLWWPENSNVGQVSNAQFQYGFINTDTCAHGTTISSSTSRYCAGFKHYKLSNSLKSVT